MSFGEKLQNLRKEKKMSQEQLADKLGISRQAVSKWESDQTYPEMDKLIALTKIFDCSMDDLVQKEKGVLKKSKDESKKNILANPLEELLDLIRRSYKMLQKMRFVDIVCFICEMFLVLFVLICLGGVVGFVENLANDIFYCFGPFVGDFLSNVFRFILVISYVVLAGTIFIYIYKIRYLDRYEAVEEIEPKIIKNDSEKKTDEIVIRRIVEVPKRTSQLGIYLKKIFLICLKVATFFCGIPFIFSILFFSFAFAILIFLIFKGVFYFGIFFGLIFLILLNIVMIEIIFDFLFDHSISKKRLFFSFLIGLIGLGISSGIFTLELANTTYLSTVEDPVVTEKKEFVMNPDLKFYFGYHNVTFNDNGDSSKVTIEVNYHKDFNDVFLEQYDNDIRIYSSEQGLNKKLMNMVIRDLESKKLQNYSLLYDYEIIVSTSKENYDIISNNVRDEQYYNDLEYYQNEIDDYQQRIDELEEEISLKEEELLKLQEDNAALEEEKVSVQEKMDDLKEQLDSIKEQLDSLKEFIE